MSRLLPVLLLTAGALLAPTKGQGETDFNKLSDVLKTAVNLAIKDCNEKKLFKDHLNFFSTIEPTSDNSFVDFNFYMKVTHCSKTNRHEHRGDCKFNDKRPLLDCVVCGRRHGNSIESPYIHCVPKKHLVKKHQTERKEKCDIYRPGQESLLFQRGCEGCY
ncbi:cystatin-like protein [Amia ocellicauda]|uniref:cystatin-like protein n=1 Tax=Amia ocellicauda TaxID=2972642 RepID=UPI0034638A88